MRGYEANIVIATQILAQSGSLASIAERPLAVFVSSVSRAYLKSKDTPLSSIVHFSEAVGRENFLSIIDALNAKDAVDVLSRVDPRNAGKAKADATWARMRLAAVLTGDVAPRTVGAPRSSARTPPRTKTHPGRSVISETDAFSARRRRVPGAAQF